MLAKIRQIQLRLMGEGDVIASGPAGPLSYVDGAGATLGYLTTALLQRRCKVALATM